MADLDDFFAKKDRKKNKTSKKFSTTEEVAKKLEDTAKKTEKQKKERVPEGDETNAQVHEQDEWKEFEEEKKDYTGLKIGNLTIGANQESSSANQETGSGDQPEGSETGQETERKAGPWKRIDVQDLPPPVVQEEAPRPVEKKPEAPAPASSTGSVYKPPSMRFQSSQPSSAPSSRLRGNKGGAPDIHNEDFFPTLSKSGENKKTRNEGSFEVVQHNRASSYRQQKEQTKSAGGPTLNLGNRYNTLSNDS